MIVKQMINKTESYSRLFHERISGCLRLIHVLMFLSCQCKYFDLIANVEIHKNKFRKVISLRLQKHKKTYYFNVFHKKCHIF